MTHLVILEATNVVRQLLCYLGLTKAPRVLGAWSDCEKAQV